MKKESIFIKTYNTIVEDWQPTCNLRYVYRQVFASRPKEKILQQLWRGSLGSQKWEDVPVISEP